ncbi:uncharacterized protein LOC128951883 [Oppia nitens]|uniref:uncharacterized protein LOC128951883 n=1 Tax=Oppia nitens TaxID=1686743 RepID=UPI0023DBAFB5|nr:uncharacterized protein LOC128951883 [Oppia nitens]
MSSTSNDNGIDFNSIIKTDATFITPNDKFNSFTVQLSIGSKSADKVTAGADSDGNGQQVTTGKEPKVSTKRTDDKHSDSKKFVDFVVNQYKSDGIVCTLDDNDHQIYYCYYCHQYINDFDLIQQHLDTAIHLRNVLNGISLSRGLDKEFVVVSNEEKPKDVAKMIYKQLSRMPFHLKLYYFRNGIRLMDIKPPNAYYCEFCKQTIEKYKEIDRHLSTESHLLKRQKPKQSLDDLIAKAEDETINVCLNYISEDEIDGMIVYECELCNWFDCDSHKMFGHIQSFKHRVTLLKNHGYELDNCSEPEVLDLLTGMLAIYGKSVIKKASDKKLDKSSATTPTSHSAHSPPKEDDIKSPHTPPSIGSLSPKQLIQDINFFIKNDILLAGFESHKIIQTLESDGRAIFYCCFCDQYYTTYESMERHVDESAHKKLITNVNISQKGLNTRFMMKNITETNDPLIAFELDLLNTIPIVIKHFYFKRGIKYFGGQRYYCRFCQKLIDSFTAIEEHFQSESHMKIEENPTKFNDLLVQTDQPLIGLKFISELFNETSKQLQYECTLCDYNNDIYQMFQHLSSYLHHYKILKKLTPNNEIFQEINKNEVSLKSSELLKKEIDRLERNYGCGFPKRDFNDSNAALIRSRKRSYSSDDSNGGHRPGSQLSQYSQHQSSNEQHMDTIVEQQMDINEEQLIKIKEENPVIDIKQEQLMDDIKDESNSYETFSFNEIKEEVISGQNVLTDEELLTRLSRLLDGKVFNEYDAAAVVTIIESLKDNLIKYYSKQPTDPPMPSSANQTVMDIKIKTENDCQIIELD